jgi:hypothetical protein
MMPLPAVFPLPVHLQVTLFAERQRVLSLVLIGHYPSTHRPFGGHRIGVVNLVGWVFSTACTDSLVAGKC